ncbi:wd40 repeat protein [Anaeramoeba flamelloides]|uniref:Wd40 repeat protein n=1 Tax=Anaeramoeba flamelloides TaxID=1746091 RepID=A0ABQ8Z5R9_9EUKA|nr:wd40 repeat protein [Anaeramoeba flamelloides]
MFSYQFSNLIGMVYKQGNLIFTRDGRTLLSPVGNRISMFNLEKSTTRTLPIQTRHDIKSISLSPDQNFLVATDKIGEKLFINFNTFAVLKKFNFGRMSSILKFNNTGKLFCVAIGSLIELWRTPSFKVQFSDFEKIARFTYHNNKVTCLEWSKDGTHILTGSEDMSVRVKFIGGKGKGSIHNLFGHKNIIVGAFFSPDEKWIYSVSYDGTLIYWKWYDGESVENENENQEQTKKKQKENPNLIINKFSYGRGVWKNHSRFYLKHKNSTVKSVDFQKKKQLLVVGYLDGSFSIFQLPGFTLVHTLKISDVPIDTVCFNPIGDWVALATKKKSQLLVWEWASETHILKQQGHSQEMTSVDYSPDGRMLVSGGNDNKVKVWNTENGFCFITFKEHKAPVTDVKFSPSGNAVFSSSLDGTIRAFDLIRYRNFRIFTTPKPAQFSCIAIDPSGELICAGTVDDYQIPVWSIQTGKLLDVLWGHEGAISSLSFAPFSYPLLISGSWDKTARIWDIFKNKDVGETLEQGTGLVLCAKFRPDGKEFAVSTSKGQIYIWDAGFGQIKNIIEGKKDLLGGRKLGDLRAWRNRESNLYFESIEYSADGKYLICSGNCNFICIYHVEKTLLVKKFKISSNVDIDGVIHLITNRRNIKEGVDLNQIALDNVDKDGIVGIGRKRTGHWKKDQLPGVKSGFLQTEKRLHIFAKSIKFSPDGRSFSCASTEGLLMYSLDKELVFDPMNLGLEITSENALRELINKEYLKSLIMAIIIGEKKLLTKIFFKIPFSDIPITARNFPRKYLERLISFIAETLDDNVNLEYLLLWIDSLFTAHSIYLKKISVKFLYLFRAIQKQLNQYYSDLSSLCDKNSYRMDYILVLGNQMQETERIKKKRIMFQEEDIQSDEELELKDNNLLSSSKSKKIKKNNKQKIIEKKKIDDNSDNELLFYQEK